jgi:hypothetical protein
MNCLIYPAAAALTVSAALGLAGSAIAQPDESEEPKSAVDAIAQLQSEGKSGHVVGAEDSPLQSCDVANVVEEEEANVVTVEVTCEDGYPR